MEDENAHKVNIHATEGSCGYLNTPVDGTINVELKLLCQLSQTLFSIHWGPAWPARVRVDRSNEDVKIKIDFVTQSSLHASEWLIACLACRGLLIPSGEKAAGGVTADTGSKTTL